MKVEVIPEMVMRRGAPVKVGNVYSHPRGRPVYKIVLGVMERIGGKPWSNVCMYKVHADGTPAGASCEPEAYVKDHQDLVGYVREMPSLKVEWFHKGE